MANPLEVAVASPEDISGWLLVGMLEGHMKTFGSIGLADWNEMVARAREIGPIS